MESWQSAIFYTFLGYLLFHMMVDDLIHCFRAFYTANRHPHEANHQSLDAEGIMLSTRGMVTPVTVVEDRMYEATKNNNEGDNHRGGHHPPTPQPHFRQASGSNQRAIVLVVFKICDVILYCLMGYFHTFTTCWCACITCLDSLLSKYIAFLEAMVQSLTAYPGVIYLSGSAVCCMGLACVIVYIVF